MTNVVFQRWNASIRYLPLAPVGFVQPLAIVASRGNMWLPVWVSVGSPASPVVSVTSSIHRSYLPEGSNWSYSEYCRPSALLALKAGASHDTPAAPAARQVARPQRSERKREGLPIGADALEQSATRVESVDAGVFGAAAQVTAARNPGSWRPAASLCSRTRTRWAVRYPSLISP